MQLQTTALSGVLILTPTVYSDDRGFFYESFNNRRFEELTGISTSFVQDNHSRSVRHVIRGLHYQINPPQGKLIRAISGEVLDIVVDLRKHSPTFGQWLSTRLSVANQHQLWVPPGFAHGFMVISDVAELIYKTTDYWNPESERSIRWDDPDLAIAWPLQGAPILSDKDKNGTAFADAEVYE